MKTRDLLLSVLFLLCLTQCKEESPTISTSSFATNAKSGADFLTQHAPKVQTFEANSSKAFGIKTINGLEFKFPANAFSNHLGTAVTGNVQINITEYQSKADMLFSGVTTTTSQQILKSAGMFEIRVSQTGADLSLANVYYEVTFPAPFQNPNMRIFEGMENSGSSEQGVIWEESKTSWVLRDSFSDTTTAYQTALNFLGWCNLDAFYQVKDGVQVRVKVPKEYTNANTKVFIIFEKNAAVTLIGKGSIEEFNSGPYSVPVGEKIRIVAVAVIDGELRYALQNSTTTTDYLETITSFTPISETNLEKRIREL